MSRKTPATQNPATEHEQLLTAIREAHEVLGDLNRAAKDARTATAEARAAAPEIISELLQAEVKHQVGRLGEATEQAMSQAVDRVNQKFDQLAALLMGEDPKSRRAGKTPLPDLITKHASRQRATQAPAGSQTEAEPAAAGYDSPRCWSTTGAMCPGPHACNPCLNTDDH